MCKHKKIKISKDERIIVLDKIIREHVLAVSQKQSRKCAFCSNKKNDDLPKPLYAFATFLSGTNLTEAYTFVILNLTFSKTGNSYYSHFIYMVNSERTQLVFINTIRMFLSETCQQIKTWPIKSTDVRKVAVAKQKVAKNL